MSELSPEALREALKEVFDPELGYNIVDLGLIYGIEANAGEVRVTMTMTTPGCPAQDAITFGVTQCLSEQPGVENVAVDVVWEPRWSPRCMSPEAKEYFGVTA